ncbi:copper homeostasis protein CutC [Lacibacter luteus]|uniref:PF03932 family protein CutC n=1 Tax=Lacibacter luteus TaxID=2508719 RepID=A0A4Q1CLH5_9BACT|nr:copper homeostasis protein CutC [Lacibacter luteus]RXK61853.1 copper homeostasis protein CutC [Lacibacter luteus]
MNYKLEVIAFSIESCSIIQKAGAHRIELCDNPGEGGTTPSCGMIKKARELASIELYTMIRPRGGDFFYNADEFDAMKEDIKLCKQLGCDGVVFGLLNTDGTVDKERTAQLVELAYPMGVTFHRAFDRARDAFEALETIIDIGCERVLTSGLHPNVTEGKDVLKQLVTAADDRIIIMPGSGVRHTNLAELAQFTGAVELHTSARTNLASGMKYINTQMNEDLLSVTVDEAEVLACVHALKQLQQLS